MSIFKKMSMGSEIRALLGVLDEAAVRHARYPSAFAEIRAAVERDMLATRETRAYAISIVKQYEGRKVRQSVFQVIALAAQHILLSGKYEVYAGLISPRGEEILVIYDDAVEEVQRVSDADDPDFAHTCKLNIRESLGIAKTFPVK